MDSLDFGARKLVVRASRAKTSADFIGHLEQLDRIYGPKPGRRKKPVVLVLDNGPIHLSKASRAAFQAREHWLAVEWPPKYAPNSTTSRSSGTHSRPTTSPIRPSPIPTPWNTLSMPPSISSTPSEIAFR
ncbi:transposase [Phenylobacterium sp.]|uniref:transposase n=1 Tax=Phenylobacterium sp. TaxID=1871053 RepID=UPI00286AEFD5|nr:transposase [Phenylobacterium sp.]